ncbi:GNAT family N-acetyltransferase [Rhizobium sullae]|uniref:GNAT family N-acetyltransferase n=1 Tax=Rhizobium sullae TaxID=50338 RepID=A0ABY5XE21_RHISU|nr:GNAT family N-acetyltransferase [Rhizobium sullae]UWU12765.1 GNAT family N-acetyltransferase [Rhizobium sullae]
MPFSLRRLSLEEMDRAAIILRASFDERLPWLAGLHTPTEDRAYFREHVFSECEVWGALEDEIVGFIAFRADWIDLLYVLPSWQGQGAGDALLQVAKGAASSLQLWTAFQSLEIDQDEQNKFSAIHLRQLVGAMLANDEPLLL